MKTDDEKHSIRRLQFLLQRRDRLHMAGLAAGYFAGALIYLPVLLPESVQGLARLWDRWPQVSLQDFRLSIWGGVALTHAVLWVLTCSLFSDYQLSHGRVTLWAFVKPSLFVGGVLALLGPLFGILGDSWFESGVVSILGLAFGLVLWLSLHAYWWVAIRLPPDVAAQAEEDDRTKREAPPPASQA